MYNIELSGSGAVTNGYFRSIIQNVLPIKVIDSDAYWKVKGEEEKRAL